MITNATKLIWNYRGFIKESVKREFQIKYRNSLFGAVWSILNPLSMILVYTVIFSQVMKAKLPGVDSTFAYSIYLCSGIFLWGLFSEIVTRAQNVFIDNSNLIKKIHFPRLCLPVIIIISSLLNFFIIFSLFSFFLTVSGNFPGVCYIGLIPVIGVLVLFAIGLGITLGVMNVFFRDVGHFFGIFMQFWFWLTPIVYSKDILPIQFQKIIELNPLALIVIACQTILVKGQWPEWTSLLPCLLLGVILSAFGLSLFRKHAGEMVDEL